MFLLFQMKVQDLGYHRLLHLSIIIELLRVALVDQIILKDKRIFGVDLYEVGLAEKVLQYFNELIAGKGAVRATLKKYVG